jgi:hypothetical protein
MLSGSQKRISWYVPGVMPLGATTTVSYKATPESGSVASQPLFINRAWVKVNDTILVSTNSTYHQGAGVSIVTFSASAGGSVYNAEPQAVDYRTTARAGILLIVPDEGYEFAGWSHDAYTSLRGEPVKADSGLMNYEEIVIYGDVDLRADFVPAIASRPDDDQFIDEEISDNTDNSDKVWSHAGELYIRTTKGATARIYTVDGLLMRELPIIADGVTTVSRLTPGVYIVTLHGGRGTKVVINYER